MKIKIKIFILRIFRALKVIKVFTNILKILKILKVKIIYLNTLDLSLKYNLNKGSYILN